VDASNPDGRFSGADEPHLVVHPTLIEPIFQLEWHPVQEAVHTADRPRPQILLLQDGAILANGLQMILKEKSCSAVGPIHDG
jgi:hypothetical protein